MEAELYIVNLYTFVHLNSIVKFLTKCMPIVLRNIVVFYFNFG